MSCGEGNVRQFPTRARRHVEGRRPRSQTRESNATSWPAGASRPPSKAIWLGSTCCSLAEVAPGWTKGARDPSPLQRGVDQHFAPPTAGSGARHNAANSAVKASRGVQIFGVLHLVTNLEKAHNTRSITTSGAVQLQLKAS
jgi:hypothetical protein